MQKHKSQFQHPTTSHTISDVQHCLRLNDLHEVGDGTHYLDFHMLGLFSFDHWSVQQGVDFWMGFCHHLGVIPDTVTIPPYRPEWRELYRHHNVVVIMDPECVWSDGSIGGDCTEFYKDGVEIGNIVHPLNRHLDCGFGMERLERFLDPHFQPPTRPEVLLRTISVLLDNGVMPSNTRQGYVLRKLLRECFRHQFVVPIHQVVDQERSQWEKIEKKIPQLLLRHPTEEDTFFWETYGVPPEMLVHHKKNHP